MTQTLTATLDDSIFRQIRQIAREEGISVEETTRRLLSDAVSAQDIRVKPESWDSLFPVPTD
jgi:hypothetical protein